LRAITQEAKAGEKAVKRPDLVANLGITLALLEALLEGTGLIHSLWAAATTAPAEDGPAKRRALAQELAALFGSGRVVSYAGEALQVMKLAGVENKGGGSHWIADGAEYTRWFVQNITRWASCHTSRDDARLCSDLLARSMRLGYTGQ
jgi:telomere length regulation protein